ncbi:MAG: hypothetical protein ACYC0P_03435 [Thiobacillus sp.]
MKLRTLCAVAVLGGAMTVVRADPVVLGPVQMDAITAAGAYANAQAHAEASANGLDALTQTLSNVALLNGVLPRLTGYGGGSQAAAMVAATGPSAYVDASATARYGAAGEATALAAATGPSAFAAIGAGVVSIRGQDYLTGYLAGGADAGVTTVTAPIALSASSGVWSLPAMRPAASAPAVSVASTAVSGGELVAYTLTTGDRNGDTSTGDHATLSLTFFKPPRSRIPPMIPIDISGAVPVTSTTVLHAIPVAM